MQLYVGRRILFAGLVGRMEDIREVPKCVMFGELVRGAGCVGSQKKVLTGCFLDDLRVYYCDKVAITPQGKSQLTITTR